jgi:hypothetical protein
MTHNPGYVGGDVAAFITSRLDEDEAVAKAAIESNPGSKGEWSADGDHANGGYVKGADDETIIYAGGEPRLQEAEHVARHDPARVLREIEAHRLTVKLHDRVHDCPVTVPVGDPGRFREGMYVSTEHIEDGDCTTLCALAAIWGDHPDNLGWRFQ